jgi:hypothetical protein
MANRKHLEALKMANAQRKRATLDKLKGKTARQKLVEVEIPTGDDDGSVEKTELLFRSIGSKEYDDMVTSCPPTAAQKKDGAAYNIDRFAPKLLAAVCIDPAMTEEEATELWTSEAWNRGELFNLFTEAVALCLTGVAVDPIESASA